MRSLIALSLLTACGSASPLGGITPEFSETAAKTESIVQARVYLADRGRVRALSLYHRDAAAIPPAVTALGAQHFPGKRVRYYETEWYPDAGLVYEIEYHLGGGRSGELAARADGTLIYVETPVDPVPPALAKAALAVVGGGTVKSGERQLGPGLDFYGVKVERDGRLHVVLMTPQGEVVRHSLRLPAQIEVPAQVK